jgi:hypothetical protein
MKMNISLNNAIGLLEQCLINGIRGKEELYDWFESEESLIEHTVTDLTDLHETLKRLTQEV